MLLSFVISLLSFSLDATLKSVLGLAGLHSEPVILHRPDKKCFQKMCSLSGIGCKEFLFVNRNTCMNLPSCTTTKPVEGLCVHVLPFRVLATFRNVLP